LLLIGGYPVAALTTLLLLQLPVVAATLYPHATWFGPVLRRLPTREPAVWLTIDDGPSGDTHALLDLLDEFRARATFFLVSERAARHPDLVQAIHQRGHDIGNHSETHPAARFWALSAAAMADQVGNAQRTLTSLSGTAPRWFRAVVGHANPFVAPALAEHGLTRVSWSARGFDGVSGDVDRVVARLSKDIESGAIILLHEGAAHGRSVVILRRVLEVIAARGLRTLRAADVEPRTASY
jgi:peptidoglycan/xylan/chitin deacetylase (PgdA/CDA1 family)